MSLFPDGSFASLAVPVLVLAIHVSAPIAQVLLKSTENVYAQPFIDVLRAKGASPSWIFFRHALKNAAGTGHDHQRNHRRHPAWQVR